MTRPCLWAIGLGLLPTRFLLLIRIVGCNISWDTAERKQKAKRVLRWLFGNLTLRREKGLLLERGETGIATKGTSGVQLAIASSKAQKGYNWR